MGSTNKKGFQNSRLVDKIKKNGSASLPQPNDRNVRISKKQVIKGRPLNPTLPYLLKAPRRPPNLDNIIESSLAENNINWSEVNSAEYDSLYGYISEQEIDGGIVGGKLIRPKYDNVELEKSIDTRIFELIPTPPAPEPDTVPRPIYNDVVNQVEDLTEEVERLNITGSILNSTISELQIINDSLRVEADNERLKANIANDQRDISNAQVAETTIDLQNAIQNSINEAIQRVSLTARNEALAQENESLREQLFGLSAQTAEGAKSGANNNFTVKVTNPSSYPDADIYNSTNHKVGSGRPAMTNTIEISNVTTDLNITNVAFTFNGNPKWFKVKPGATSISSESSETYQLEWDNGVIGGIKPKKKKVFPGIRVWDGKAAVYKDLTLKVKVTFDDGSTDEISLTAHLRKNRKS